MGRIAEIREALVAELEEVESLKSVYPYVMPKKALTGLPAASIASLPIGQVQADTMASSVTYPFQIEFVTSLKSPMRAQEQADEIQEGFLERLRKNPTLGGLVMLATVEPTGIFDFDEEDAVLRVAMQVNAVNDESAHDEDYF